MIKLDKNFHPICLSPDEITRLTAMFKADDKASVWNIEPLKSALLETSYGKCAYCECDLTKESKYMEVEHFYHKNVYPDQVVKWENLLPSCKRCNVAKGSHDVGVAPIINPYTDDPRAHLQLHLYRMRAKSALGEESKEVLDLNNSSRAVAARFQIGEGIQQSLITAKEILDLYSSNRATRTKNRLLNVVKNILLECQPSAPYAATAASVLHRDPIYSSLAADMKALGLWDVELSDLHAKSSAIML